MPLTLSRSFLVNVLPGFVAIAPWVILVAVHFPQFATLYEKFSTVVNGALVGAAILVGAVLETAMGYLENWWDEKVPVEAGLEEDWYEYLSIEVEKDRPIGFEYISRQVTSLYFELTMIPASFLFFIGISLLPRVMFHAPSAIYPVLGGVAAVASAWMFKKAARHSFDILFRTRKELVTRIKRARTERLAVKAASGPAASGA